MSDTTRLLAATIAVGLAVGALGALITGEGMVLLPASMAATLTVALIADNLAATARARRGRRERLERQQVAAGPWASAAAAGVTPDELLARGWDECADHVALRAVGLGEAMHAANPYRGGGGRP